MNYSRDYEQELLEKIRDCGASDSTILEYFLVWLSSSETCEILEDFITDYDL